MERHTYTHPQIASRKSGSLAGDIHTTYGAAKSGSDAKSGSAGREKWLAGRTLVKSGSYRPDRKTVTA